MTAKEARKIYQETLKEFELKDKEVLKTLSESIDREIINTSKKGKVEISLIIFPASFNNFSKSIAILERQLREKEFKVLGYYNWTDTYQLKISW